MAIYLIRHAQSVANVNGRAQSHASIELTEVGHLQAQQLLTQLPTAHAIYISIFLRTYQTAQYLIQRDQIQPVIHPIEEFSYLSDLRCKNTLLEERKPWVDQYWGLLDIDYQDGEDAESFRSFYHRVKDFGEHLKKVQNAFQAQSLMVFSHGQFLTLFKMVHEQNRLLGVTLMKDFRQAMIDHPIKNTEYNLLKSL